jgi:ComF family protein
MYSLFIFAKEGVEQALIHRLKYQHSKQTGFFLGKRLGQKIKNKIQEGSIDLLVSVPSHHRKKYDRGYNQSETIAKGLSEELKIPLSIDFAYKTKNASSQTRLNKKERAQNVKNSFLASRKFRNVNSIGLVDDVITTGATIKELCKSIREMNRSVRITIFVLGVVRHD